MRIRSSKEQISNELYDCFVETKLVEIHLLICTFYYQELRVVLSWQRKLNHKTAIYHSSFLGTVIHYHNRLGVESVILYRYTITTDNKPQRKLLL